MEIETSVKTLPVSTDSTSKGYIMYNPAKFDVIPVTGGVSNDTTELSHTETAAKMPANCEKYKIKPKISESSMLRKNLKNVDVPGTTGLTDTEMQDPLCVDDQNSSLADCPQRDESSFTTVFQDIHAILNDNSDQMDEVEGSDVIHVKCEPGNVTSEEDNAMSYFSGTYKDIQSGLSEGEHSSNSADNFEMVYVKCDPEETNHFFTEKQKNAARKRAQRKNESPEARARRLIQIRDAARFRRQRETMEQRTERLRKDREKKRKYRAKMREDNSYEDMLAKNRIIMRIRRQNELYREKERERDRIRHQIKRANTEFRDKEKIKERERKRFSRFLKKYAEQYSTFHHFAQQLLCPSEENTHSGSASDVPTDQPKTSDLQADLQMVEGSLDADPEPAGWPAFKSNLPQVSMN